MIIYPAIDIKDGRCVMLKQGISSQETIYSHDPVEVAKMWEDLGASFLHIVDLDGAFYGELQNTGIIEEIIAHVSIPVQIGGGFRTLEKINFFLREEKVARVILGTSAIMEPELLIEATRRHCNRIAVGIDAKDGKVAIRGWVEKTDIDSIEFGKQLKKQGVETLIYTDISKDGMLSGPNISVTKNMVDQTGLNIIASGGISRLEDIESVKKIGAKGVIIGKALYTGAIELKNALGYEGD